MGTAIPEKAPTLGDAGPKVPGGFAHGEGLGFRVQEHHLGNPSRGGPQEGMLEKELAPRFAPAGDPGVGDRIAVPGGDFARPAVKKDGEDHGTVRIEAPRPASEDLIGRGVQAGHFMDLLFVEGGADVAKVQSLGSQELTGSLDGIHGKNSRG